MQKIEILIRMFGNFCKEHATFKVRKNCLSLLGRRLAHVSVFKMFLYFLQISLNQKL